MNKKLFSMAVLSIILLSGIDTVQAVAQNVSPASDFECDLNGDGTGVVILKYVGKGGDIVIPDSIEDFPVVSGGCGFDNLYLIRFIPKEIKRWNRAMNIKHVLTVANK